MARIHGNKMTLLSSEGGNIHRVKIEPSLVNGQQIKVAHDYVEVMGNVYFSYDKSSELGQGDCAGHIYGSIQIPIRTMKDIILPLLNNHPELSPLSDKWTSIKNYLITHNYIYLGSVLKYRDPKSNIMLVSFRKAGKTNWTTVDFEIWDNLSTEFKIAIF